MKFNLLGVNIDAIAKAELLAQIGERLRQKRKCFIVTPYSEMIVEAQSDQYFKIVLNSADFAIPDGIGILWAANFLSRPHKGKKENTLAKFFRLAYSLVMIVFSPSSFDYPIPEKISGSSFIWDLAELGAGQGSGVYLLGGFGDTAKLAADKLREKFPDLKIRGTYSGNPDEPLLVEKINASGADILFVAFGPKAQEKWIFQNLSRLNVSVAIGLGGTFDYLARKRALAPIFFRSKGLEWAWRLVTQPWRLRRILKGVLGLIYHTVKA